MKKWETKILGMTLRPKMKAGEELVEYFSEVKEDEIADDG